MATTRYYLDQCRPASDGTCLLKITFTKDHRNVYISLDVRLLPSQWDARNGRVIGRPDRANLNAHITKRKSDLDLAILRLTEREDWPRLSAYQVRDIITGRDTGRKKLFAERFRSFALLKERKSTREIYLLTLRRMADFDPALETRDFKDITVDWLTRFDLFLARTSKSKNGRNVHLRNIRAVFNAAIDDEITSCYPFRRFRIKPVPTPKRSLSVEKLRQLFAYPVEHYAVQYLDMFKLIFLLIGINMVDLYDLTGITSDGRIEYTRAKTGRAYSIKVEPEALEIIERYRGRRKLLYIADNYDNYKDYMHRMNRALQETGENVHGKHGSRTLVAPFCPNITTYWARHSWATIAASLDIPKETIAAALGHGGNTVTDIYIDFDRTKVDQANRRVIDWVLYNKK